MIDEKCALMLADSHTLKALPGGLDTPPEGMEAFGGGSRRLEAEMPWAWANPGCGRGCRFTPSANPPRSDAQSEAREDHPPRGSVPP